jgi:hypothetical protein
MLHCLHSQFSDAIQSLAALMCAIVNEPPLANLSRSRPLW